MIEQICDLIRHRLTWSQIANVLGIHRNTLILWRKQGKDTASGIYHNLVVAVEKTKGELYHEYSAIVRDQMLNGAETTTTKIISDKDGNILRIEDTRIKNPPDPKLVLKMLAIMNPAEWAEVKHMEVEWRESIEKRGLDPDAVKKEFFKRLAERETDDDEIVIPKVSDKEV